MRHRIKHHVGRPVLHLGLFTDSQMLPASAISSVAAGWFYAGSGGLVARTLAAAIMMLPVGVMVVDNRVGGIVVDRVRALVRWHRDAGVFSPEVELDGAEGYGLTLDAEDELLLKRESDARVDLELAFAEEAST